MNWKCLLIILACFHRPGSSATYDAAEYGADEMITLEEEEGEEAEMEGEDE